MTTPAHDSVAYLPARPRLALLRKEADQLISCTGTCVLPTRRPRLTIRAQAVRFENSKTILNADSATAMGEYYFTTLEGTVAKVEYTFQYKRGADGNLKIVVHHSSLPYSP